MKFWKPILQFTIILIVGSLIIISTLGIVNNFKPKEQLVKLDIRDRVNGICAEMYKEGFDWGLGQAKLQVSEWKSEGKTEDYIKEGLYDWFK
jgi:hypothetical protein